MLGLIIETITKKSLGEFMQDRLWQPLGMVDTSFNLPNAKRALCAGLPLRSLHRKPAKRAARCERANEIRVRWRLRRFDGDGLPALCTGAAEQGHT